MKRASYIVSSFDCAIELVVEGSPAFHEALLHEPFWSEFIPGFQFKERGSTESMWQLFEASSFEYSLEHQTISTNQITIKKSIVIIEAVFERMRQQQSLYTLHGCVIARDNQAVALIGNLSGIGKTTLASYAAKHGWSWVGDEKFTISGKNVVGVTQGILSDSKTHAAAGDSLPVRVVGTPLPLALICQPIITDERDLTEFKLAEDRVQWVLYDEITRDIRQVDGILTATVPPLPSFDSPEIAQERLTATNLLVSSVPVFYLRGPKALVLEKIEKALTVAV